MDRRFNSRLGNRFWLRQGFRSAVLAPGVISFGVTAAYADPIEEFFLDVIDVGNSG